MSEFEKYGVLEDPDAVSKTAEDKTTPKRCPACGSELVAAETVNVLICPQCGTKPFEQ